MVLQQLNVRVKAARIEREHVLTQHVGRTQKRTAQTECTRDGTRTPISSLKLGNLGKLLHIETPLCDQRPLHPLRLTQLVGIFLISEIELSAVRYTDVTFDHESE